MASPVKRKITSKGKNMVHVSVKRTSSESSRLKQLKTNIQKQMNLANKRIKRLEKNNLQDSPAYQKLVGKDGKAVKFGVRGKSYNELQSELARIRQFTSSESSTVRGVNNILKSIADNTGIKYNKIGELKTKSKQFFNIASKVEQYLRQTEKSASAIGYQKIWDVVNKYVKDSNTDLSNLENDVEGIASKIYQLSLETEIVEGNETEYDMGFTVI